MAEKQKNKLLYCPKCHGRGLEGMAKCSVCHGFAFGFRRQDKFYYWGERIDRVSISIRKTRQTVAGIINFTTLIAAVVLLLAFAYYAIFISSPELLITYDFWQRANVYHFALWISISLILFLIYRLVEEKTTKGQIAKADYGETVITEDVTWGNVEEMSHSNKVNIAKAYNRQAVESIESGYEYMARFDNEQLEPIHLFLGSLSTDLVATVFARLGLTFDKIKDPLGRRLLTLPKGDKHGRVSQAAQRAILNAYLNAFQYNRKQVSPIEIFIEAYRADEFLQELLFGLEIKKEELENVVAWIRIQERLRERWAEFRSAARLKPKGTMNRAMTALASPVLDNMSEDLTRQAAYGRLPMLVGRDREVAEVLRIIEGGLQSVVLVGPYGVGKDAIVEGLAEMMVEEKVPKLLQDKRLISLNIAHLVSGATAAQAQERLLIALREIGRSGNIILVIPEIEGMVGITSGTDQSIDLSGVLATEMEKGYFFVIGTTTQEGYSGAIERSAIGQQLQKVLIDEPEINEAIQVLESKIGAIEYRNHVLFSYDAVREAVTLSDRLIHDRYLPSKAITIAKETALKVQKERGKDATVTGNDIAKIISEKTKVPVASITEAEGKKLLNLEEEIHKRIIGQEEAVKMVSSALRRARTELRSEDRPIANFLFLGPTGVGKTELAKTVAATYFGSEDVMIRLDMSEYQEAGSINRLIGAPGSSKGGLLSESVRLNPFSLVLLDELEKAHPDILNVFLQVMDDGRLTDSLGRTIDFTNVILIATSNAGTQYIQDQVTAGTPVEEIKEALINTKLRDHFRPEFLNRFDGTVVFKPLTEDEVEQIAWLMIAKVAKRLDDKGIHFEASDEAVAELARKGFDPKFGARPLRRVIQQDVDDALANFLLKGKLGRRDKVVLEQGGEVRVEKAEEL